MDMVQRNLLLLLLLFLLFLNFRFASLQDGTENG